MNAREFWETLSAGARDEITTCFHLFLLRDLRRWVDRRVERITPLDDEAYANRVSYQMLLSPEMFLEGLQELDLVNPQPKAVRPFFGDPLRLVGQEVDLYVPIERLPKKILLDFSISDGDGHRLIVVHRREAARLSVKKLRLEVVLALMRLGRYDQERDEIWSTVEGLDPLFQALIVSSSDEGRSIYSREGIGDDEHIASCMAVRCWRACIWRRTYGSTSLFRAQLFPRYLEPTPDFGALCAMLVELAMPILLDKIVAMARHLYAAVPGARGGLHNPVINPLLLCVDYLKAVEEESLSRGGVWGARETSQAVEGFLKLCARYCDFVLCLFEREKALGTGPGALASEVYAALANFEDHYILYCLHTVGLGRSFLIKTEQVVPLVDPWIKKMPVVGYRVKR